MCSYVLELVYCVSVLCLCVCCKVLMRTLYDSTPATDEDETAD